MPDDWRLDGPPRREPGGHGSNGFGSASPAPLSYPDVPDYPSFRASTDAYDIDASRLLPPALPTRQTPPANPLGLVPPPVARGTMTTAPTRFVVGAVPRLPTRPPPSLPPVPPMPHRWLLPPPPHRVPPRPVQPTRSGAEGADQPAYPPHP